MLEIRLALCKIANSGHPGFHPYPEPCGCSSASYAWCGPISPQLHDHSHTILISLKTAPAEISTLHIKVTVAPTASKHPTADSPSPQPMGCGKADIRMNSVHRTIITSTSLNLLIHRRSVDYTQSSRSMILFELYKESWVHGSTWKKQDPTTTSSFHDCCYSSHVNIWSFRTNSVQVTIIHHNTVPRHISKRSLIESSQFTSRTVNWLDSEETLLNRSRFTDQVSLLTLKPQQRRQLEDKQRKMANPTAA